MSPDEFNPQAPCSDAKSVLRQTLSTAMNKSAVEVLRLGAVLLTRQAEGHEARIAPNNAFEEGYVAGIRHAAAFFRSVAQELGQRG